MVSAFGVEHGYEVLDKGLGRRAIAATTAGVIMGAAGGPATMVKPYKYVPAAKQAKTVLTIDGKGGVFDDAAREMARDGRVTLKVKKPKNP